MHSVNKYSTSTFQNMENVAGRSGIGEAKRVEGTRIETEERQEGTHGDRETL